MIPVNQTIFNVSDPSAEYGNCLQACVASIFELPLEDVPHFCSRANPDWFSKLQDWCESIGYAAFEVFIPDDGKAFFTPIRGGVLCIASGKTHRHESVEHSVVARTTGNAFEVEYIHDPYADGGFLTKLVSVCFFIPIGELRAKK